MPKVTIPGVGEVNYPDSMSDTDIMAHAQGLQNKASQPMLDPTELPAGELFKGAWNRGIEGLKGTALDLIPAMGGSLTGHDKYAQEQMQEYQDRMAAAEAENPTAYKSLNDIKNLSDIGGFAAETAGMLAPDALGFMAGTGVGSTIGKFGAKKLAEKAIERQALEYAASKGLTGEAATAAADTFKGRAVGQGILANAGAHGAKVGAQVGLIGTSEAINVPDTLQSIYKDTGQIRPGIALTIGSLVGALDTAFPEHLLSQLGTKGKTALAVDLLNKSTVVPTTWKKAFIKEVAKDAGLESLTEGAQQALQIAASQIAGDKQKFFSPENVDSIIMASLQGAMGGVGGGAIPSAMSAGNIKNARNEEIARRQELAQQQADALAEQQAHAQAAQEVLHPQSAGPQLGYTPSAPNVMPVTPQGTVFTSPQQQEENRFQQSATPQEVKGYQPDMFPQELGLAQSQARAQGLPATTDQALAGPPAQAQAGREFTTSGLAPDQVPSQFKTVLDADTLKGTGLKPQSGFYKQLLDKDIANPKDQTAVRDILVSIRNNPKLSDSTKQAIESIATNAFGALGQQTNMVGPRGGILREVNYGRVQPRPIATTSGTSTEVPESTVSTESAQGTGTSGELGVGPTGVPTDVSAEGTRTERNTLNEEPTAQATPTAEEAPVAQPESIAEATPTETLAPALVPNAAKNILTKKEARDLRAHRDWLQEGLQHITDPKERAAANREILGINKRLEEGKKAQVFEGRSLTTEERRQAEEDFKTQKKLMAKIAKARKAVNRAENLSENSVEKVALRKAEAEYDAFEAEARPRADARTAALTGKKAQVGEGKTEFNGDIKALAKGLRAALDKMGLSMVGVKLERALTTADGQSAQGQYARKLIEIALNAANPMQTLNHEALHAMKELGFFTNNDWNTLRRMAQNMWLKEYDIANRYPNLSKEEQIEEAIAEAFANRNEHHDILKGFMHNVVNLLNKIGNWLRGNGFRSAEDIFSQAANGELAKARADVISNFEKFLDTQVDGLPKHQVAASQEVFGTMDRVINSASFLSEGQQNALSKALGFLNRSSQSGLLSTLPLHALADLTESTFPGLSKTLNQIVNRREGFENGLTKGIDVAIKEAKIAKKVRPEQEKSFYSIVHNSTLDEVDPTKDRKAYIGNNEKLEAWDKLNKEYNKLSPVWKNLYVTMRDGYKHMHEEVLKAIEERIDATNMDPENRRLVKADIMAKLAKRGTIDPYFALGRVGDKWLGYNYKDANGQMQRGHEAFESSLERSKRMEELQKAGATEMEPYEGLAKVNFKNAPANSFINSVLRIMEVNKVPQETIDETMNLFLTTLPETAFAQSFQRRKGTMGFNENAINTFSRKMRGMAHQVANMKYNPKLTDVISKMREVKKVADHSGNGSVKEAAYLSEYEKRIKSIMNPTRHGLGNVLTSAAFTSTLGFNLSSAVVNMANVPMIVAPYLKGKYSEGAVARALGDAAKIFAGSGTRTNMEVIGGKGRTGEMRVMPSIANYAPDSAIGKKYATAIKVWNDNGQLKRSQLYELINADPSTGVLGKLNAMSGWMFHHGERMNREVTMIASYNLEMERLAKDIKAGKMTQAEAEEKAANLAIETNEMTNGSISAASAPRINQNIIGKMAFMYKRYGVSMYYMMFRTAKEALKGESPEVRKAAWRQLGGIVGMSALMAGAQGIPMYGLLSLLWGLFHGDDEEDLDAVTRKHLGEFMFKGPIEYFTNLSIAGRITLNDLIIRDNKSGSAATTFSQQVAQTLGGPVFGVGDRMVRGYSKMASGNIERGLEDLLPSAIGNGFKAYRYYSKGADTLRGDPITGDVNIYNAAAQAFGFAPANYSRQLEMNATEKGIDKALATRQSNLKQKYYMAKREGDFEHMNDIRDDLLALGEKHPELGINGGNVTKTLNDSVKAQERATKEMIHGVRYTKKRLAAVKASQDEYEGE